MHNAINKPSLVAVILFLCLLIFVPMAMADDADEKEQYDRAMGLITSWKGQSENLDLAMTMAHIMLKKNPNSARAYTVMGRATDYAGLGDGSGKPQEKLAEAKGYYHKAIELDPDFIEPYYFLAICHVTAREFDQAMQLADTLQKKSPDWPPSLYIPILVAKKKNDYKQIIPLCLELQKKFPDDKDTALYVNMNLLTAYEQLSMMDEAEALYLKLIAEQPNSVLYLDNYAGFLNDYRQNYDKAIEYAQKALAIADYPDGRLTVAMAATNKAKLLYQSGNLEEAEKYCLLAIGTRPQHVLAWVGLSKINYTLGLKNKDPERLEKALDAALKTKQHGMKDPEWDKYVQQIKDDLEKIKNQSQKPQG